MSETIKHGRRCRRLVLVSVASAILAMAACTSRYTKTAAEGTSVTSSSEVFRSAAKSLQESCSLPAEFGRCGCTLDGFQTSCDIVHRCIENGFCVAVSE